MKKFRYTFWTIVLLMFLFIPFIIRSSFIKIEPFPSIVMPSGSHVVRTDSEQLVFKKLVLYGIDAETGAEKPIPVEVLLGAIPPQYLTSLYKNGFSIDSSQIQKAPKAIASNARTTPEAIDLCKAYFRQQLSSHGYQDSLFIIRDESTIYNLKTKSIEAIATQSQGVYELY